MLYGTIQGRFLAPDGARTPLTGHIIFEPLTPPLGDAGMDYVPVSVTGVLDETGNLTAAGGSVLSLAYGQWRAHFRLKYEYYSVPIKPLDFTLEGNVWVTQIPGSGWEFEITPLGDGTADLLSSNITYHNDGTATLRIG